MVAVFLVAACERQADRAKVPDLNDVKRITAGRAVYDKHCAACHGTNQEGQLNWTSRFPSGRLPAPPHDDSGRNWRHASEVVSKHFSKESELFWLVLHVWQHGRIRE